MGAAEDLHLVGDRGLGPVRLRLGSEIADLPVKAVDGTDDPPGTGYGSHFLLFSSISGTIVTVILSSMVGSGDLFLRHSVDDSENLPVGGCLGFRLLPCGRIGCEIGAVLLLPALCDHLGILGSQFLPGRPLLQAEFLQDLGQFFFEIHNV